MSEPCGSSEGLKMAVSAKPSLRYELICDGAVRKYPDGREVCCDTAKGCKEYQRRTGDMAENQKWLCILCGELMHPYHVTFEHLAGRGMGAGHRDDRESVNGAAHLWCNSEKGSKRPAPI